MRSTFFGMKSDSHLKNTRIALKTADVNFLEIFLNFYKEIGYAESEKAKNTVYVVVFNRPLNGHFYK